MLVEDIREIENKFYKEHSEMVVPELLCAYFEQNKFELTYYFADMYQSVFGQAKFYLMMSLMEMGYTKNAYKIYRGAKGDWFNLCKQGNIYWKHVALFALLFKDIEISEYYENVFNEYYEDAYIQLLELLRDEDSRDVVSTETYKRVVELNPIVADIWKVKESNIPKVITFENVEWNIWNKYNNGIKNGQKYGMEVVYSEEGLEIYSYKPKEVAASMHIITDRNTTIVLDCGCEITDTESIRIQAKEIFEYYGLKAIDAVFISHAHMDHYGSLNEIKREKIYMTSITKQLIRLASPETALSSANILEPYSSININCVEVAFVPNGHIRGSVAMDINWKNKKRIVYTGDFSVDNQKTVSGFNTEDIILRSDKKIDILLTETTYGKRKDMLTLRQYEKIFVDICSKQIEYGNKVIIPCFAIGRVQEVALLLSDMVKKDGKKILIDGMAARITEYYQLNMDEDILSRNISICNSELEFSEKLFNNDVILASSGMIKPGSTSAKYIEEMIEKKNTAVIKVGFIHKDEHMLMSIVNRSNLNINFVDIPLSAHVSYMGLVETLEKLSPDCAIYVHGLGIDR